MDLWFVHNIKWPGQRFHWTLGKDCNLFFLLTSVLHGFLLRFMEYLVFDSLIIIGRCPWSCKAIRKAGNYYNSSTGGCDFSRVFTMPYFLSFIIPDWIPQGWHPSSDQYLRAQRKIRSLQNIQVSLLHMRFDRQWQCLTPCSMSLFIYCH